MNSNILKIQKNKKELNCTVYETLQFGMLLAIVGGFLDAYTYVGRGGVFANAQTGNIVLLGIHAASGNWVQALYRLPSILAFVMGVIVAEKIKNSKSQYIVKNWPRAVLIFEIIVFIIIGFIPPTVPNFFINVTISFIASVQVCSFKKLVDSNYSTTMCTGNLRSASESAYKAFKTKDNEAAVKAYRYFTIILSFIFGGFLGSFLTSNFGVKSIWAADIVLICAVVMLSLDEYKISIKKYKYEEIE